MTVLRALVIVVAGLVSLVLVRVAVGKALGPWVLRNAEARFEEVFGELASAEVSGPGRPQPAAYLAEGERLRGFLLSPAEHEAVSRIVGGKPWREGDVELVGIALARSDTWSGTSAAGDLSGGDELASNDVAPPHQVTLDLLGRKRVLQASAVVAIAAGDDQALEQALERLTWQVGAMREVGSLVPLMMAQVIERDVHKLARARFERSCSPPELAHRLLPIVERLVQARGLEHALAVEARVFQSLQNGIELSGPEALFSPWTRYHFAADPLVGYSQVAEDFRRPAPLPPTASRVTLGPGFVLRAWLDPLSPSRLTEYAAPNFSNTVFSERWLGSGRALTRAGLMLLADPANRDPVDSSPSAEVQLEWDSEGNWRLAAPASAEEIDLNAADFRADQLVRWRELMSWQRSCS